MVPRCSGTKVPLGARAPPTIDVAVTGPPAHFADARWVVRFGSRRDAAHRGPLEASVTDLRTDFGADEGSARKIPVGSHEPSNHDLSASSRNASRRDSSFAHRHPSIASRRTREAIVRFPGAPDKRGGRGPERGSRQRRTAGDLRRSLERLRDPIVGLPRCGAERIVARQPGGGAIGNPTHRPARLAPADANGRRPALDGYTRRVPAPLRGDMGQGNPWEVLRSRDQGASSVP